jgi:hypothetical protein
MLSRSLRAMTAATALLAVAAVGCGKGDDESSAAAQAKPAEPAAPPPPFGGTLTVERVLGARDLVKPFDAWQTALPRLEAQLGEATVVDDDRYTWAVIEGDACAYFYVTRENEREYFADKADPQDIVGTVMQPARATADDDYNWRQCMTAAGQDPDPEDPDAPAPPADGAAVSVDDLRDGVARAKSRWVGEQVTLAGVYLSTSTSSSGDQKSVTLSIAASADDRKTTTGCTLADPDTEIALRQGDPVVVTGVVDDIFGGRLRDCALAAE